MKDMFNYLMHKLRKRPSPGDPPSEFPKNTGSKYAIYVNRLEDHVKLHMYAPMFFIKLKK